MVSRTRQGPRPTDEHQKPVATPIHGIYGLPDGDVLPTEAPAAAAANGMRRSPTAHRAADRAGKMLRGLRQTARSIAIGDRMPLFRADLHRSGPGDAPPAAAGNPPGRGARCIPELVRFGAGHSPHPAAVDRTAGVPMATAGQYRALLLSIVQIDARRAAADATQRTWLNRILNGSV